MRRKVKQLTAMSEEAFAQLGADVVPLPPVYWFVRGPRGGLYEASASRYRRILHPKDDKRLVYIVDTADEVRYVRPRSSRYKIGAEALGLAI